MNKKWIEHNKKEYGVQIIELKKIIANQVRDGGKANEFTSDMLVAIISGRKITEKMQNAINGIIKKESPDEKFKRDDWLQTVLPKLMMVKEMISETTWTKAYSHGAWGFMDSVIKQAKTRKTLSKKQMEAVNKLYHRVKKNIEKNKNNA